LLLYLLYGAGLSESDIVAQVMDSSAAAGAFIAGRVDAASTWEPWLSKAAATEHGHLLASTKEHRGVIVDVLAMDPDFVRESPEDVTAIIHGWFDAVEFWRSNPAEANEIMANFFGISVAELEDTLGGVEFADLARNIELFGAKGERGRLYEVGEKAGRIWQAGGIITEEPLPIEEIIEPKFIHEVAASQGD
jgi:NitT/TauT family transport system substrate-binding protein